MWNMGKGNTGYASGWQEDKKEGLITLFLGNSPSRIQVDLQIR